MKHIPIIIDTDPGVDDALSLITILKSPKRFDIKLIASVAGNVNIDHTTKNVLYLVENFNSNVKVARGAEGPLVKEYVDASDVHGSGGFGNFTVANLFKQLDYTDATEAYVEVLTNSKKPVYILAFEPLTNIAKLITEHKEVMPKIKRIYTMSGSYNGDGNVTKYSEYNTYCDPEAFSIVLNSGLDICFLSMELGHETKIPKKAFIDMNVTRPAINMIKQMILGTHETAISDEYFAVYDLHVPAVIVCSSYYTFKKCDVTINLDKNSEKYGQVIMTPNKKGKYTVAYVKKPKKLADKIFYELYKGLD